MKEVKHIAKLLRATKRCIQENNINELKNLSNQTIHSATISQDGDNIIVAVLIYALGKIFEREHYQKMQGWELFQKSLIKNLGLSIKSLESEQIDNARTYIGRIRNSINKISGDLSRYIKDVFVKAQINKAFKLYEHGISTEKTAELLGVSLWDLASYIGQSSVADAKVAISMPEHKRIKIAEEFFG